MCGICGEIRFDGVDIAAGELVGMRERLAHRGPDSSGVYTDGRTPAGLGFRRLRIIDLSPNADQPMTNEDGSVRLVFNGEIYNFRELRYSLQANGHQFRSQSDTETIVHLYEEAGVDAIARLDGMFAIAIWDERRQQLVLARDRAGKKPLFYYRDDRLLAFSSEIKSFFGRPDMRMEIDPDAVPQYLVHGYVPPPRTFYRRVQQLPPATCLVVGTDGRSVSRRYWQLTFPRAADVQRVSVETAAAGVRERVMRAVERRLVSDVPLGAFLSGGIDSTIVVGAMSALMREPVKTFSIGFEGDDAYDETSYARMVADRFGTEHTEFRVAPSVVELVDPLIWHHDGPFGDSSALPTYVVSRLTREKVTVVLTGDGGDEVFAGYMRFVAGVASERVPRWAGALARAAAAALPTPASDRHWIARAKRFAAPLGRPLEQRVTRWNSIFFDDMRQLLRRDFVDSLAPFDCDSGVSDDDRRQMEGRSPLARLLHANFVSYLPGDLLVKTDRCTMAHSLEARSPFLDRDLIEYAAALPDDLKLRRGQTKFILKRAFADLLPDAVLRRSKMGFGVPVGTWFRSNLREYLRDVLLPSTARYREMLDGRFVERLVEQHLSARMNLGPQLWTLVCFERWLQLLPSWSRPVVR